MLHATIAPVAGGVLSLIKNSKRETTNERWALLCGVALLAMYFRYLSTHDLEIVFWLFSGLAHISEGELLLWLAHGIFVVPASLLIGWGLTPWLSERGGVYATKITSSDRNFRIAALCFFVGLFLIYSLLAVGVMLDLPITDDELGVQFGAKAWVEGRLTIPLPVPEGAYFNLFTYSRGGQITSFDWPGPIAIQAASQASGLGQMLYALIAAIGGLATAACANRWLGRRAAILTAALWLLSPMGLTLSLTTHAHVLSRTCIALAFYCVSVIDTKKESDKRWWPALVLGMTIGLGALTRPFEVTFILAPVAIWLLVRAIRKAPGATKEFILVLAGMIPFVLLHGLYNWVVSGNPILPPRFDLAHMVANDLPAFSLVDRVGNHVAHNFMMIAVFAIGPLAAFGAGLAPFVSDKTTAVRLLAAGVVSFLLLALAHDNVGIHSVGPIHYSEALVPILLLFVFFAVSIANMISSVHWRRRFLSCVASYTLIALGLASFQQLHALGKQADMTNLPLAAIARQNIHNAIVVAPARALMYPKNSVGSWVLSLPPPFPGDDILFVHPQANLQDVRAQHPERSVWRLHIDADTGQLRLFPVE